LQRIAHKVFAKNSRFRKIVEESTTKQSEFARLRGYLSIYSTLARNKRRIEEQSWGSKTH